MRIHVKLGQSNPYSSWRRTVLAPHYQVSLLESALPTALNPNRTTVIPNTIPKIRARTEKDSMSRDKVNGMVTGSIARSHNEYVVAVGPCVDGLSGKGGPVVDSLALAKGPREMAGVV